MINILHISISVGDGKVGALRLLQSIIKNTRGNSKPPPPHTQGPRIHKTLKVMKGKNYATFHHQYNRCVSDIIWNEVILISPYPGKEAQTRPLLEVGLTDVFPLIIGKW